MERIKRMVSLNTTRGLCVQTNQAR